MVDINEYLSDLSVTKASEKLCETELNKTLLRGVPNVWSNQAYVQGFYCKTVAFKDSVNTFESMEIAENIYEGVVEP